MKDPVYKLIELTGTSTKSLEEAVNTALTKQQLDRHRLFRHHKSL